MVLDLHLDVESNEFAQMPPEAERMCQSVSQSVSHLDLLDEDLVLEFSARKTDPISKTLPRSEEMAICL
jgi:hypothetical protein